MNRKYIIYTLISSLVLGLGSCTSEDFWDTFDRTVDGPIDFTVDIESSPAQVAKTRGDNMQANTKVLLRVEGIWKRKGGTISDTTTCYTDGANLKYVGHTLYWDDFGTGDPDNIESETKHNRENGLKVYGVAVDGMTTTPKVDKTEWQSLPWSTVDSEGKTEVENSKLKKDIIVSNNLSAYKFDDRTNNQMVFKHLLSKITINITASDGFLVNGKMKFKKDPELIFTNGTSDYALTSGKINILTGETTDATVGKLVAGTINSDETHVLKEALVFPGTEFAANSIIAKLEADSNFYNIKSDSIRAAIDRVNGHANNYKTKAGYNYILNIFVKKTGVVLSATVAKWTEVNSGEVCPVINVNASVGEKINKTEEKSFSFNLYRSESIDKDYLPTGTVNGTSDGKTNWTFTNPLYWENHNKHYHFRGIYPADRVVTSDTEGGEQYVVVENGKYDETTFPSNFMIGMPEIAEGTSCGHTDKDMSKDGICARDAAINLNFRYMMSQVEVNLTSSDSEAKDYVNLTYCDVKLVNVGTKGKVMLGDRSAKITEEANEYLLPVKSSADNLHYHGIIVPQTLVNTDKTNKVRLKITVYKDSEKKIVEDVYYADVAPILKSGTSDLLAPNNKWERGVHYKYNLKITKTEIKATATLKDWETVTAEQEVWF